MELIESYHSSTSHTGQRALIPEEYKLANGCSPWTSSDACPEIQLAECFAEHMASVSWLLVSWRGAQVGAI